MKAHGGIAERSHVALCGCGKDCKHCYCLKPESTVPIRLCCWCGHEQER